jgi:starch synthase
MGDVLRDVPVALAQRGCEVDVVTPGYGFDWVERGAVLHKRLGVDFSGAVETVELYRVSISKASSQVRHWVIEHRLLAAHGEGRLYCDDPPSSPFATDATRFALFCAGVCEAMSVNAFGALDVMHLHDWHTALVLALRRFCPKYMRLPKVKSVFTIHNLAVQGIRPFQKHQSSLQSWYPELRFDSKLLGDPRWPDCVNPMAVGIRMADKVHTVSPSYAREICMPSRVETAGFYGGEGLEDDLIEARDEGRLFGILNGCDYSHPPSPRLAWPELCTLMDKQQLEWAAVGRAFESAAHGRIASHVNGQPAALFTSVGRVTEQKLRIFLEPTSKGGTALERILGLLGSQGILVLLGTGNAEYEHRLRQHSVCCPNFVFLCGYSEHLAEVLYTSGDLFLMPSSYEPCGISQMLAMRAGQPCLVHAVGGLNDTVREGASGFTFHGNSPVDQADQFVTTFKRAFGQFINHPSEWKKLRKKAGAQRFTWNRSIDGFLRDLYT